MLKHAEPMFELIELEPAESEPTGLDLAVLEPAEKLEPAKTLEHAGKTPVESESELPLQW